MANTFAMKVTEEMDKSIVKAVCNVGVECDKEELVKALHYDRQQYQKGYEDGYNQCKANILNALGVQARGDNE